MSDYKELLSRIAYCTNEESCDGCPLDSGNILRYCVDELLRKAADAIEQLCADVARLEAESRAKEQYIAETIGKLASERKRDDEIIASLQRELVETAKERDQWMTLGHLANKRAEDYLDMRRQRDKAIKERDAAIADLRKTASCLVCKHFGKNGIACTALNPCHYGEHAVWEWRGVGED